ncbi:MAG: LptF/LptG family permease [Ignavibacteria bacterium]|nr:LptF/LptG family permease [Ignavibacteria bacterium]
MILWRHILRAHVGPFLFANAIIIFLFLLQFLMKSAGDLVGKGLSFWVILELIALNLAWMLVLAVPMSVLVASLMAFGRMSAENEIVIMRASGMSLYRMLAPGVLAAAAITAGLIHFNNRVLPEANIRLRTLMTDILRIKPTLSLQAGVFTTDEQLPGYRILVRKTFEKTNDLEGVTIYDLSRPDRNVVVTAQRGTVGFSPDYSKIFMDLRNGEIHELNNQDFLSYRRLAFEHHRVAIPASGFGFQRSDSKNAQRDDRTMNAAMMRSIVDSVQREREKKRAALAKRLHASFALQAPPDVQIPRYGRPETVFGMNPRAKPGREPARALDTARRLDTARIVPAPAAVPSRRDSIDASLRALATLRQQQAIAMSDVGAIAFDDSQADKYLVEIYKKYSIPVACMVFVLIGVPLGMMARRGGFGVGAGLSLGFFLFYWACLIGGEKLADRDVLSPFMGMWVANMVLGACGVLLTVRAARETTVIDWTRFTRFVPKSWRTGLEATDRNPHEA